jgi:hypothetical protein
MNQQLSLYLHRRAGGGTAAPFEKSPSLCLDIELYRPCHCFLQSTDKQRHEGDNSLVSKAIQLVESTSIKNENAVTKW